jgi:hypothetical protein
MRPDLLNILVDSRESWPHPWARRLPSHNSTERPSLVRIGKQPMNTIQKIRTDIAVNWLACLLSSNLEYGWLRALAAGMILLTLPIESSAGSPAQVFAEFNYRIIVLRTELLNKVEGVFPSLQSGDGFRECRPELGTSSNSVAPLVNEDKPAQRQQGSNNRKRPSWNIGDYTQVYILTPLLLIPLVATLFKQHHRNQA